MATALTELGVTDTTVDGGHGQGPWPNDSFGYNACNAGHLPRVAFSARPGGPPRPDREPVRHLVHGLRHAPPGARAGAYAVAATAWGAFRLPREETSSACSSRAVAATTFSTATRRSTRSSWQGACDDHGPGGPGAGVQGSAEIVVDDPAALFLLLGTSGTCSGRGSRAWSRRRRIPEHRRRVLRDMSSRIQRLRSPSGDQVCGPAARPATSSSDPYPAGTAR